MTPIMVSGAEAVQWGTRALMQRNKAAVAMGLGVCDPGRVFGTTAGLLEEFGPERVFDGPTSELAMTGMGVGMALSGMPVVHSHQRMDFALLAMDQLVNSAAKWAFMFGEQFKVPYLARFIVGRGWGQGPTHSQNLESWLAHIPGIRVLTPSTCQDLYSAIRVLETSDQPIALIEPRWLHYQSGEVDEGANHEALMLPELQRDPSSDAQVTIVAWGLAYFDVQSARKLLLELGITIEILKLNELDETGFLDKCLESTGRTGRLLIAQNNWGPASFGSYIGAKVSESISLAPKGLKVCGFPFQPQSSSPLQMRNFHVSPERIANTALQMLGKEPIFNELVELDQPNNLDFGPF